MALVNGVRAGLGLAPLARNADLERRATDWAASMAASGTMSHSTNIHQLVGAPWSIAAENVGYGADIASIHAGLVASPGHYANIVEPAVTQVGIGMIVDAAGVVWVTQLFAG